MRKERRRDYVRAMDEFGGVFGYNTGSSTGPKIPSTSTHGILWLSFLLWLKPTSVNGLKLMVIRFVTRAYPLWVAGGKLLHAALLLSVADIGALVLSRDRFLTPNLNPCRFIYSQRVVWFCWHYKKPTLLSSKSNGQVNRLHTGYEEIKFDGRRTAISRPIH